MNLSAPFTSIHFKFLGEGGVGGGVTRKGEVGERVNALKPNFLVVGTRKGGGS